MSRTKTSGFCCAIVVFLLGWLAGVPSVYGYDGPWPKIFDYTSSPDHYGTIWSPRQDVLGFQPYHPEITPVPRPGTYSSWNDSKNFALYDEVIQQNRPLAVYLTTPETFPLTGTKDPQALSKTINYLSSKNYRLDYLFMEFEPVHSIAMNAEVAEAVRQVRTSADPQINRARWCV